MVLSISNPVIQELVQDANALRIKKLMYYACKRIWETDPGRLDALDPVQLVQDLWQIAPNLEQLNTYLLSIARTLSKPVEYTLIANLTIAYLGRLYPASTQPLPTTYPKNYAAALQQLAQDPEVLRIKKLIFCACKQTWQNDPAILNAFSLEQLVQELHHLTPTAASLDALLTSIVCTLNRSAEYTSIAQRITQALQPLYREGSGETMMLATPLTLPVVSSQSATAVQPELSQRGMVQAEPAMVNPVSEEGPAAVECAQAEPMGSTAPVPESPPVVVYKVRSLLPQNLVPLRMELLKYANPLRAKILLFSLLHYTLDHSRDTWSLLKSHEMDDLLRDLFRTYPLWHDVEAKLRRMARALPEPTKYAQVAEALLKILRSCYTDTSTVVPVAIAPAVGAEDPTSATELSQSETTQVNPNGRTLMQDETACLDVASPATSVITPVNASSSGAENTRVEAPRVAALPLPAIHRYPQSIIN